MRNEIYWLELWHQNAQMCERVLVLDIPEGVDSSETAIAYAKAKGYYDANVGQRHNVMPLHQSCGTQARFHELCASNGCAKCSAIMQSGVLPKLQNYIPAPSEFVCEALALGHVFESAVERKALSEPELKRRFATLVQKGLKQDKYELRRAELLSAELTRRGVDVWRFQYESAEKLRTASK